MKKFQFKLHTPPELGAPVRDTKGKQIGVVKGTRETEDGCIVTVEVDEDSPVVQKLIEGLRGDTSIGAAG